MRKVLRPAVLYGALLVGPLLLHAADFHVALDGKDGNPGTKAAPFASLEKARDAVRTLRGEKPGEPATVWIRGGVYRRMAPFALDKQDSGTQDAPVVYAAVPGESVTLFGGTMVQREWFSPVKDPTVLARVISPEARDRLLQVDLKAHGITDYGELSGHGYRKNSGKIPPVMLYVSGKRMTLARWPNPDQHFPEMLWKGDNHRKGVVARSGIVNPGPKITAPDFLDRGGTFRYAFDRPALWTQAEDVWLDGVFAWSWEWSYNKVARIDPGKKEITLRYGEVSSIADQYSGNFFFAENLLEEMDVPGEYYLDRVKGVLYLLPGDDFKRDAPVWLSALKSVMLQLQDVSDVVIRGLVLDTGLENAFAVRNCTRVRLEHCEIKNFAGAGGDISGKDCVLASCHIHDVGASGVWIGGGDFKTLAPGGNTVENCEFHDFAWYHRVYTPAVGLSGVGQRVAHNLIYNCPHGAVLCRGNNPVIEYNEFHHVCREFIDLGAIYINTGHAPLERGWVIRRNWFHDIAAGADSPINVAGVYVDHSSQGGLVEENVFQRIGNGSRGWASQAAQNPHGLYTITRNNVFVDCTTAWRNFTLEPPAAYVAFLYKDYKYTDYFAALDLTKMPHLAKYPEVRFFLPGAPTPTEDQLWLRFERNLIWNPNVPRYVPDGIVVQNRKPDEKTFNPLIKKDNWVADTDPGFVDAAAGNLELRPDAPVFARIPGFQKIPFKEIGLKGPAGPVQGP